MIGFGEAIRNFFRNYFNFSGTATRAEFWWIVLALFLCLTLPTILMSMLGFLGGLGVLLATLIGFAALLLLLASIIPLISLGFRRYHDAGFSGMLFLLFYVSGLFIAFVQTFVMTGWLITLLSWVLTIANIVILVLPSKMQGNPYRK